MRFVLRVYFDYYPPLEVEFALFLLRKKGGVKGGPA